MRILKYKQIFSIIAIAVISLTASVFAAIACANVINNNASFNALPSTQLPPSSDKDQINKDDTGDSGNTWKGSGTSSDPYLIYNATQLKSFFNLVNKVDKIWVDHGYNYYDAPNLSKCAKLMQDIDCLENGEKGKLAGLGTYKSADTNTKSLEGAYAGTFDGNGHTISNFQVRHSFEDGNTLKDVGFANRLSGTIKNLKLKDCYYFFDDILVDASMGGFVGTILSGGKVENCYIEDVVIENYATGGASVGGIVGQTVDKLTSCTITNCFVKDMDVKVNEYVVANASYIKYGGAFVGDHYYNWGSLLVTNCVLTGNNSSYVTGQAVGQHHETESYDTDEGLYLGTDSTYSKLGATSSGGTTGSIWYRASGYKSGVPQLRVFMDWRLVKATVRGSGVFNEGIYLPSDYSRPAGADLGKSNTITLLQQRMTLTRPSGCLNSTDHGTGSPSAEITGWVGPYRDKDNTFSYYIMEWKEITRTVTLSMSTDANKYQVYYGTSTTNLTILKSEDGPITITIKCGTKISISVEKYLNNIAIKSVTYSFKDSGGTNRVIKFTTEGLGYYITSVKGNSRVATSGGGIIAIVNPGLGVEIVNRFTTTAGGTDYWHWDFSFAVETEEKTYIPNFP